jgi:hypothetical protein
MSLYIIATEDLSEFLPENGRSGGKTSLDVSEKGVPRMFTSERTAKICLGMWLSGPFQGDRDEGGWYAVQRTDPARREVWEGKLGVREVKLEALSRT